MNYLITLLSADAENNLYFVVYAKSMINGSEMAAVLKNKIPGTMIVSVELIG